MFRISTHLPHSTRKLITPQTIMIPLCVNGKILLTSAYRRNCYTFSNASFLIVLTSCTCRYVSRRVLSYHFYLSFDFFLNEGNICWRFSLTHLQKLPIMFGSLHFCLIVCNVGANKNLSRLLRK
jgi:hypothetical protein